MKNIKLNDLEKKILLAQKELEIIFEAANKTAEEAKKATEELGKIMDKTLHPRELTEERIASLPSQLNYEGKKAVEEAKKAAEELGKIMDKKLHPTGLTEERIAELRSKLDYKAANKAAEELDRIMEQRLAKMGLTEEEYVSMFMNAVEE
ncbi:hypothetical protein [Dapis sp. BLCC M172]|uniref:hypothetical protein n=1 Tax=Dapis sp. BLCC M172 TaxID=2975281 RepID=UPI003CFA20A0